MPVSFLTDRAKIAAFPPIIVQFLFALLVTLGAVSGGVWGGIGIGGALLLALVAGIGQGRFPWPPRTALLFIAAFFVSASLSSLNALDPSLSWHRLFKMATILLPLSFLLSPVVLDAGQKCFGRLPLLFPLALGGLAVLALASLFGILSFGFDDAVFVAKLNRGFSYLLMIGWPLLAATLALKGEDRLLTKGKTWLFVFFFIAALGLNHSRAAQTGVVLSAGVFLAALWLPQLTRVCLGAVTVLASAWPFAFSWLYTNKLMFVMSLPKSWLARTEIWDNMAHRILERPWLGFGLGNSAKVSLQSPHSTLYVYLTSPVAHPHNAITQLWGEMGLLGLVWGLCLALWVLREIGRLPDKVQAAALAAYTLTFWLTMMAYNLWTDSLWSAMAFTCLAFALLRREKKN